MEIGDITAGVGFVLNVPELTAKLQAAEQLARVEFKPIPVRFDFSSQALLAKAEASMTALTGAVRTQTPAVAALVAEWRALGAVTQSSGLQAAPAASQRRGAAMSTEATYAKMLASEVRALSNDYRTQRTGIDDAAQGMKRYGQQAQINMDLMEQRIAVLKGQSTRSAAEIRELSQLTALYASYSGTLKSVTIAQEGFAKAPVTAALQAQRAAMNEVRGASTALNQEILNNRRAWQEGRLDGQQFADTMAGLSIRANALLAPLKAQKQAILDLGVPTKEQTQELQRLEGQITGFAQAAQRAAAGIDSAEGRITRGSLAAGVQAGTAGLNNYKASLFSITSQTELLTNQERAGIITTKELNLALKEQATSLRTGLAAVDAEVMGLKTLGVLSLQETERLAQLTQSQNGYTAALARTLEAQQRSNAMGARAGFAQGAGLRGNLSSLGMAASLVSPEAGMLGMAASFPPVVAGAAAVGLAVAGVVKLTKDGQDEVKKLQQAYLSLKVNGVHDIGEVDKALDHMIATGSTSDRMFSKAELAEGLALMSRSGFKGAEGILALASATRLAASEGVPLDEAVKRLAANLQHLGLTAEDAASFGDKLVRASHLTQDSADAFSKGMNVVGFTAKEFGYSIDETLGFLTALSLKGLDPATIGSTGLRNAMLAIEKPSKAAKAVFAEFGVQLVDTNGHARKGRDIFSDLIDVVSSTGPIYSKTTGMLLNANDKAAASAVLFGTRSFTAFQGVKEGSKEATETVAKSANFMVHSSDEMASGYEGAQHRMTAATKDLSRAFAETFTPTLTAATVKTTEFFRWLGDLGQRANDAKPYLEGLAIVLTAVGLKALAATGFVRELLLAQSIGGIANVVTVASTAIQLKMLPALTGLTAGATGAAGALKLLTTLGPLLLLSAAAGLGIYVNTILDNIHKIQDEVAKTEADVEKQQAKMWSRGREGQLEKQRLDLVQADTTGLSAEILKHRQDDIAKIGQELAAIRAAQKALPAPVATGAPVAGSSALEAGLNLRQARTGTPFGQKYFGNQIHNGEDLFAPVDTPVTAPFAGFATTRWSKTTGHIIELIDATGQKLLLGHLNGYADGLENAIKAAGGKLLVKQGQLIGYVGQTGSLAHADLGPGNSHTHVMGYDAQGKVVSPFSLKYQGVTDGMNTGTPPNIDPKFAAQAAAWKKEGEALYAAFKSGHYDVAALKAFQNVHKGIWDQIVADAKGAAKDLKTSGLSDADWAKYGERATQLAQMQADITSGKITGVAGRHDQNAIDSFSSDLVKAKAFAYASKQLADAKRLSDESNRIATEQANFTKTLNKQTSDTAISTAQATLKSLEANRDAALQSSKKDASRQLQVEQEKGAAILNVQRDILSKQRDQAIQAAHDTATRSRTDAEALYGKGKTPQARLDEISALEKKQVRTANTNYATDAGTAQAQQDRRIIEAKARVQAESDKADAAHDKALKDAAKARADTLKALRDDDVKGAEANLAKLNEIRDRELAAAKDNVIKQVQIAKDYAAQTYALQHEINLAKYNQAYKDAEQAQKQRQPGLFKTAQTTFDADELAARNKQTQTVTTATDAVTSAVQKQRDAYSSIADTLRQSIKDGSLDAEARQKVVKSLNDQHDAAQKLGILENKNILPARDTVRELLAQADAAYLTAQRLQGMVSGNTEAADSAMTVAESLNTVGQRGPAIELLTGVLSGLMDSAARGEAAAADIDKVRAALNGLTGDQATEMQAQDFLAGLDGTIDEQLAAIQTKIEDPSTSSGVRAAIVKMTEGFGTDSVVTGSLGDAGRDAVTAWVDGAEERARQEQVRLDRIQQALDFPLSEPSLARGALDPSNTVGLNNRAQGNGMPTASGEAAPLPTRVKPKLNPDGTPWVDPGVEARLNDPAARDTAYKAFELTERQEAYKKSLQGLTVEELRNREATARRLKDLERLPVILAQIDVAQTANVTSTRAIRDIEAGSQSSTLEDQHTRGLVSERDYLAQRQQLAKIAAFAAYSDAVADHKDSVEAYAQLQATLTALDQKGVQDRTALDKAGVDSFVQGLQSIGSTFEQLDGMAGLFGKTLSSLGTGIQIFQKIPDLMTKTSSAMKGGSLFDMAGALGGWLGVASEAINVIGGIGDAILNLSPGFAAWKKNLTEVANLEKSAAGANVGLFKNPFADALNEDAAKRDKLAGAGFFQRLAWGLFGGAPQVLSDEAAKLKSSAATIFADLGQGISSSLTDGLMNAFNTADWSGSKEMFEKSLNKTLAQMYIAATVKASGLESAIQAYADAKAGGKDGAAELAKVRDLASGVFDTAQVGISAMSGYGSEAPTGITSKGLGTYLGSDTSSVQFGLPSLDLKFSDSALASLRGVFDPPIAAFGGHVDRFGTYVDRFGAGGGTSGPPPRSSGGNLL